jgi:hypothetical protein
MVRQNVWRNAPQAGRLDAYINLFKSDMQSAFGGPLMHTLIYKNQDV